MMPAKPFSRIRTLLVLVVVFCFVRTLWTDRHMHRHNQQDFYVYDTAAVLIHRSGSAHLYDQADTGGDPQFRLSAPGSLFSGVAKSLGFPEIRLYLYPPILADMLLPIAAWNGYAAGDAWTACNVLMLLVTGVLLALLLGVPPASRPGLLVIFGFVAMSPVSVAMEWGQITILLMLLWVASLYCYWRGWPMASALALALATSIKLTPLIAVIPFLIWKEWKWLRHFVVGLLLLTGATVVLNGRDALLTYFRTVVPAMSQGIAHPQNYSIASCVNVLYLVTHGTRMQTLPVVSSPVPHGLVLLGKLLVLVVLAAVAAYTFLRDRAVATERRVEVLAAYALLSVVLSPVSWDHALVMGYPAVVLLWAVALRRRMSYRSVLLLSVVSLQLGALAVNDLRRGMPNDTLAAMTLFLGPLLVLCAVFMALSAAAAAEYKPLPGVTAGAELPT